VDEIIGTLVEKAQSETHFAAMYAKLCLRLSEARLPAFQDEKVSTITTLLLHQYCYTLQTVCETAHVYGVHNVGSASV
jgi:hypothetical protein